MKAPETRPTVKLVGRDGNAYAIMEAVRGALERAGADGEYCQNYIEEATMGDYNHLLAVTMEYVEVI